MQFSKLIKIKRYPLCSITTRLVLNIIAFENDISHFLANTAKLIYSEQPDIQISLYGIPVTIINREIIYLFY